VEERKKKERWRNAEGPSIRLCLGDGWGGGKKICGPGTGGGIDKRVGEKKVNGGGGGRGRTFKSEKGGESDGKRKRVGGDWNLGERGKMRKPRGTARTDLQGNKHTATTTSVLGTRRCRVCEEEKIRTANWQV